MIPAGYAARKVRLEFDGARLVEDLGRVLNDEWIAHPYGEFGGVYQRGVYYVAALLTDDGATENITPNLPRTQQTREAPVRPTPLLRRCPYFQEVLERFECEFNIARLLAMEPGLLLKKHIDRMVTRSYQLARIHIPIVTNPKARFFVHGQWIHPRVGECWYVDAAVPHLVQNGGAERRVHLVMDCVVNDFINDLVGFDIVEFRKSNAQEYERLWRRFEKRLAMRQALHELNKRTKTAAHLAVDRSRKLARRVLKPTRRTE
jgi:hypothetical protein